MSPKKGGAFLMLDLLAMLALVFVGFIPGYVAGVSHTLKKEEE